jgi:hypothetical protein
MSHPRKKHTFLNEDHVGALGSFVTNLNKEKSDLDLKERIQWQTFFLRWLANDATDLMRAAF